MVKTKFNCYQVNGTLRKAGMVIMIFFVCPTIQFTHSLKRGLKFSTNHKKFLFDDE